VLAWAAVGGWPGSQGIRRERGSVAMSVLALWPRRDKNTANRTKQKKKTQTKNDPRSGAMSRRNQATEELLLAQPW
jgi:hypothetical protein